MRLQTMTDEGIEGFREYLRGLRYGSEAPPPDVLLTDTAYSADIEDAPFIERKAFESRLDAARYLSDVMIEMNPGLFEDRGLWAWLSLLYFDQLCPLSARGTRKPGKDYRYIPTSDFRNYYRHLLAGPFRLYRTLGDRARLLLCNPLAQGGDINEQLASRQDIISNPGVMDAVDMLYFDPSQNNAKRGVTGKRRGNLRRFVGLIQQLDLTYDLYSLDGQEIIGLLPGEFERWRGVS